MDARRSLRPPAGIPAKTLVRALAGCLAIFLFLAAHDAPAADDLKPFYGTYVGVAELTELASGKTSQRDMDVVIEPYQKDGFLMTWTSVTRVDGRRDVPGVTRRVQNALFKPAKDRDMYVEVAASDPFGEREETLPMRGDPVRWAAVDGRTLHVYSFVVLEDGRYELQVSDRILTEEGLDIAYRRIVDDTLVRQITGRTVRAE